MAGYIRIPLETDPDVLTDDALDALALRVDNFNPQEAHLEVALIEIISRVNGETRTLGQDVPDGIWRYFGESLVNVQPVQEDHATLLSTWTMLDPAGYTIEDGTTVAFRVAGDTLVPFQVVGDYVVPPGTLTLGEIPLRAIEPGSNQNGYGPGEMEIVDAIYYVQAVTADGVASGGVDAESDEEYLGRLRDEMTLLTPRFVLASDAAVLARRIPGVHRALAIDNYSPVTQTTNNEKMITVAVADEDGLPLNDDKKAQVSGYLNEMREINFIVHVVDPSYTAINVTFSVRALTGYDLTDLAERCRAALRSYLSASTWGGGDEDPPQWRKADGVVRYLEVAQRLNEVEGVHYVQTLTLNGNTADVPLAGVAPLPTLGTLTGDARNG